MLKQNNGGFCYYFQAKISNILCGQKTFEDNGPPMLAAKWDCFNYSSQSVERSWAGRSLLRKWVPTGDVISTVCILTPLISVFLN